MTLLMNKLTIPQTIVVVYFSLIMLGGTLLSLPLASASGEWTSFIDAVFTATSAICVTGQVTLNTAEHWSVFGKTVIISLIEIGGLGFMTLWMLVFVLSGRRTNIKQKQIVLESLNLTTSHGMPEIVWYIVRFTLSVQALGALLLSFVLIPQLGWQRGFFYSIFHSISAFNNAGFDLFGDSLIGYQSNSFVLLVIAFLIIAGGLGFLVWRDILTFRRNKSLLRYSKLILTWTLGILLVSTLLFGLAEWNNPVFSGLSVGDRIANIFFLAATPRTAGYVNVDYTMLSHVSLFITIILMFIGGASGSTAGGAKVSTIATVSTFLYRTFRGQELRVFNRTLTMDVIRRAFFILFAGFMLVLVSSLILLYTEEIPSGFGIEYILMEVVSCFGTVGLTMGLTPHLTSVGKIVLMLLMFIGRVGLITFFWSIGEHRTESKIHYPEITIMVG